MQQNTFSNHICDTFTVVKLDERTFFVRLNESCSPSPPCISIYLSCLYSRRIKPKRPVISNSNPLTNRIYSKIRRKISLSCIQYWWLMVFPFVFLNWIRVQCSMFICSIELICIFYYKKDECMHTAYTNQRTFIHNIEMGKLWKTKKKKSSYNKIQI